MESTNHIPDEVTLRRMVDLFAGSDRIVAFTGAGISTESGIPDYRGPQGKWTTGKVPNIADVSFDEESRKRYWDERREHFPFMQSRLPNSGHHALVSLRDMGKLLGVITQNIDGLHQKAGLAHEMVAELHGSEHRLRCMENGHEIEADIIQEQLLSGAVDPRCPVCGAPLRATTVLFGESLPVAPLEQAQRWALETDLMIVIGSSLVVNPAAMMPVIAKERGATLIILNRTPTPLDPIADIVVNTEAGPTMSALVDGLRRKLDRHD